MYLNIKTKLFKRITHITLIMNLIISETKIGVDETDKTSVMAEIERVRKYATQHYGSLHNIPRPDIVRGDYENTSQYVAAKTLYRENYVREARKLNKEIDRLDGIYTELCRASKKKQDEQALAEGTFYNADELEYLKIKGDERAADKAVRNSKYYEANKEKLKLKRDAKKSIAVKKKGTAINPLLAHLVKTTEIIKPMCVCGRRCEVVMKGGLMKHATTKIKHQLFKSVIKLIHYNRRNKKLKSVVDKINLQLEDYKRVVREKRDGKSFTIKNKTDTETIEYYNAQCEPIDENVTHPLRTAYIEPVEYTEDYKYNVTSLRSRRINLKRMN
tara:strand:+ start:1969 stop:2958 length:990 start_codon:yes stop_codon:yes gene_type:complete